MELGAVVRQRYVKRFLVARTISNFGNGMSPIALAFGILHLPHGSAEELGLVLGASTLALILMSPFGGVIADKYGRIRMVGVTDALGAVGLFIQVAYFATGQVPLLVLLLVNINFGIMWGIWWPAFAGILPALVPEEGLQTANAANNFLSNVSMVIGAAAGGFFVNAFGATFALGVDATTFLIAGLMVLSFSHLSPPRGESQSTIFEDLRHGWRVFTSFRWIVAIVFAFSFLGAFWAAAESVLGPLIALKHFHGPKSWSVVLTAESIGFIIGSLIGMKVNFRYPMRALMILTSTLALYIWSLAAPQKLWIIAVCALLWGITLDLWSTIWSTALQRLVPREALSRVSSFDALGSVLFRPLGLALAAPIAAIFGLTRTLEGAALLSLIFCLATLLVPEVRRMQFAMRGSPS